VLALTPIPPAALKKAFIRAGFQVVAEDPFNWAMARGTSDEPFMIPKRGKLVSLEIMERARFLEPGLLSETILASVAEYALTMS